MSVPPFNFEKSRVRQQSAAISDSGRFKAVPQLLETLDCGRLDLRSRYRIRIRHVSLIEYPGSRSLYEALVPKARVEEFVGQTVHSCKSHCAFFGGCRGRWFGGVDRN